jgi:DNA repair protein RadC
MDEKNDIDRIKPDVRERVRKNGAKNLSDSELLAITLRTGTRGTPVLNLAARVIRELDRSRPEAVYETLCGIEGMGETKASAVLAALELGRRYCGNHQRKVRTAADMYPLVSHFADRNQEQFICASLNGAHEVIAIRVVSIGILNRTMASAY